MLIHKWLTTFGKYLILMGRAFSRPERMRMFLKQYVKEMSQLGMNVPWGILNAAVILLSLPPVLLLGLLSSFLNALFSKNPNR